MAVQRAGARAGAPPCAGPQHAHRRGRRRRRARAPPAPRPAAGAALGRYRLQQLCAGPEHGQRCPHALLPSAAAVHPPRWPSACGTMRRPARCAKTLLQGLPPVWLHAAGCSASARARQAVRSVAAGGHHTVAVTDGAVYAWGSNACGQLGTRTFRDRDTPAKVRLGYLNPTLPARKERAAPGGAGPAGPPPPGRPAPRPAHAGARARRRCETSRTWASCRRPAARTTRSSCAGAAPRPDGVPGRAHGRNVHMRRRGRARLRQWLRPSWIG